MLNSIFLESYAPLIIIFNVIFGFNIIERNLIKKKLDPIGIFLLFTGLLIYLDRLLKPDIDKTKTIIIPVSLSIVFVSYILQSSSIIYKFERLKYLFYILFVSFFFVLGWGITSEGLYSENTQYVFASIFFFLLSILIMIPIHRKKGEIFSFSLLLLSLSFTVLIFTSIKIPITQS
jgi:hypothetical protein